MNIRALKERFPAWNWEWSHEHGHTSYIGTRGAESVRVEPYVHTNGVWLVTTRKGEVMLGEWDGEP